MPEVVKITFKDLEPFKNQSLSAWCRWAIGAGYNPNSRVEVYREGKPNWELAGKCIADCSKLTIIEDNVRGPYFAKFHPPSSELKARKAARHAPYSDLN